MLERASLFLLGGGAYAALELAWRGTTHWTMFLTGRGLSLPFAGAGGSSAAAGRRRRLSGAAGVSGLELAVGAVCRRVLHIAVWDYADEWGNLAGLVCPKYTAYWFLLCGWVIFVLRGVESTVYHPQKSASRQLKSKLSYCLSGIIKAWKAKPDTERRYIP